VPDRLFEMRRQTSAEPASLGTFYLQVHGHRLGAGGGRGRCPQTTRLAGPAAELDQLRRGM